jgi:hypothetical protein
LGFILWQINLTGLKGVVRGEWDELKQHDVVFLIALGPQVGSLLPRGILEEFGIETVL